MPKFELISTKRNMTLGVIECDSIMAAELFLAMNFPNDFFGANIKGVGVNNTVFIPIEAAFEKGDTPVKIALQNLDNSIKIANGLCDISEDSEGTTYKPYKKVASENGAIIKAEEKIDEHKVIKTEVIAEIDAALKNHGYWSNSSLHICVMKSIRNSQNLGAGCIPKDCAKSELQAILRNFGFYSKDSLWIQMMNLVDKLYA